MPGSRWVSDEAWVVASPSPCSEVRPETREVVVGTADELHRDHVVVAELNWLTEAPEEGTRVQVQMRYRAPTVSAVVAYEDDRLLLALDEGFRAVTPGQSAVVFDGDRVLGGGRILRARVTAGV